MDRRERGVMVLSEGGGGWTLQPAPPCPAAAARRASVRAMSLERPRSARLIVQLFVRVPLRWRCLTSHERGTCGTARDLWSGQVVCDGVPAGRSAGLRN